MFLSPRLSPASDFLGGEITWTCTPGGQYVFELRFYRDCNGITVPNSIVISHTVPATLNLTANLVQQLEASPTGFIANGTGSCPTCIMGSINNPYPGIMQIIVYRTNPVTLPNSPPPANGWRFYVQWCCRTIPGVNIVNSGGTGVTITSIMYPYPGQNGHPCFDESPWFAEKPANIICTGYPYSGSSYAMDSEGDSLVYTWSNPVDDNFLPISFVPGYSVNSPLPSAVQNPLNVSASLDPLSGKLTFTSFTGGYFVATIKVTAYKCGIKVAEIFRDVTFIINNNCPPVMGGQANNPPTFSAPFIDPMTGLQTAFTDTVFAGDTVAFTLSISDFDLFTNGGVQTITVSAFGDIFGAGFVNPDSGCALPPCATITNGLPVSFNIAGYLQFNWNTRCEHATGTNLLCPRNHTTYYFILGAHDNYCPANGTDLATVAITVMHRPIEISVNVPPGNCQPDTMTLYASGGQNYVWSNGATGDSLVVTTPGIYTVSGMNTDSCMTYSTPFVYNPGLLYTPLTLSSSQNYYCITDPPATLMASPPGGIWSGNGISNQYFDPGLAGAGVHHLVYTFTDSTGCSRTDSLALTVIYCTGLNENQESNPVVLTPNPAYNELLVSLTGWPAEPISIELYNAYGQFLKSGYEGNYLSGVTNLLLDISDFRSGMYLVKVGSSSRTAAALFFKR